MLPHKLKEHLLLAAILRKMVFVEELGGAEPPYEYSEADLQWRHIFAQRGDAPLGYVRWRVHASPSSFKPVFGVLDMLCVTQRARRTNIGKRLIGYCIQDIATRLGDRSEFLGVFAVVPQDPVHVMYSVFVRMGFRIVPPGTALPDGLSHPSNPREVLLVCPFDVMTRVSSTLLASEASFSEPHEQEHRLPLLAPLPAPAVTVSAPAPADMHPGWYPPPAN